MKSPQAAGPFGPVAFLQKRANGMETTNVNLVGVGGQGILLTADVLARTAAESGLDVKKSEIHGMSQRGGSVSSQVRFGEKVLSPTIPDGEADFLVAFDEVEAIRAFPSVRPSAKAIVDRCYLVPITVSSGQTPAPADPSSTLEKIFAGRLFRIDSVKIAEDAGNDKGGFDKPDSCAGDRLFDDGFNACYYCCEFSCEMLPAAYQN